MKNSSDKKTYILLFTAVFISSFVSVLSKMAGHYPLFSVGFLFFYGLALLVLAGYAVVWQLSLERISLISAYMVRGLLFILIYIWSVVIFHEKLTLRQIIGAVIIGIGVLVSQNGKK